MHQRVKKIVGGVSVWPELAFRRAKKIFTLERRAVGVLGNFLSAHVLVFFGITVFHVKADLRSSEDAEHNFSYLPIPVMLIHLTSTHLTTHRAPLTCPSHALPWAHLKKCPVSFVVMDFQLWCKSFQHWHVSLRCPLSLPPLHSLSSHVMCSKINNSVTSAPLIPVSRPSVYLRFFVVLLPQLSRAPSNAKFRSGTQADIKHSFQLWIKEAGMWNSISVIDPWVIVTKYPWTAVVCWTCSRVVTEVPSQH